MGYVAKSIESPDVRRDVFLISGFHLPMIDMSSVTFASYVIMFKGLINLSQVDWLKASWDGESDKAYARLLVGGVEKFEAHLNAANYETYDCSSDIGDKQIIVQMKNTDGGAFVKIENFSLWAIAD